MAKTILGKVTITLRGAYIPGTEYDRLDAVSNDGSSYISRIDNNTAPLSDTDAWMDLGRKGDKGDPFTFADFTPEQLAILKGEKGDAFTYEDFTPEQLADLKGERGDAFEYDDFTPEQLAALKGERGEAFEYDDFTEEQIDALKRPATEAAAEAEQAAEIARNLPKIVDGFWHVYDPGREGYVATTFPATGRSPKIQTGTWWTWNDQTGQYEDTLQPVSSSYVLTKEAVEGVLTGGITTHNHAAQLAAALAGYVQKVAGKQLSTEDFTTALKNKLDGLANYNDAAVRQSISDINSRIDTLVGGSASTAIDTFNEIEAFLQGITDTKSLTGLLADLKTEITALIPTRLSQLQNDDNTVKDAAYVHTDNNFTNADKAALGRVNYTPTLEAAPGEGTLTYEVDGVQAEFRIGQLARVWDAEKGDAGEYVFYQLFDISEDNALWKLAGSGGDFVLPGETLVISLATDTGDVSALNGAVVKLTHSGEELDLIWRGQPLTVEIPYGVDYQVTPQDIGVFTAPAPQQFTSNVGYSRPLTLEYYIRRTDIIFDDSISDPANITGHGGGAILDILAKGRRCLAKKTAEGEVTICYLDDNDTTKYHDGSVAKLDGTEGDVMTVMAGDYYKIRTITPTKWACDIAEKNLDGTYINDGISLLGTYKGYVTGNKLYSRSGVTPSASISQANFEAYARARGQGYQIIDGLQHFKLARLFYAKYGTRNSQAVLGTGNADYNANNTTGTTNSLGIRDTQNANTGYVNFAGIEGIFGGFYEWVGGLTIQDRVWTIKNPDGTTRTGNATAGTTDGWITKIAASLGPYFDVIPTAVGGSGTTYYADYYEYNTGTRVLARSYYGTNTNGGVSYAYAYYDSSYTHTSIASRLAFRGVIVEAQSVSAFKALPVL